jgi:plastocyanin
MRRHSRWSTGLLGLFLSFGISIAAVAHAGQVRVTVGTTTANVLTPSSLTLNPGDQVVFVWGGGMHSVSSGDNCTSDGLYFTTGVRSATISGVQTTFTWKSPNSTIPTLDYFCLPHCDGGMVGTLHVQSGTAVANFRITEVRTNVGGNLDLIEITNFGSASGNLGRYRIVASSDTAIVPANDWVVPAGGRIVVHANQNFTQVVPGNLYLPSLTGLDDNGFVALYAPNTIAPAVTDATQMIDFVQTGAAGSALEVTAVTAGLWTAGTFAPVVASGHSLEFCGTPTDHGSTFWSEVSSPNFGTNGNCATPAAPYSWGRLKVIYR